MQTTIELTFSLLDGIITLPMKFPDSQDRIEQYAIGGKILASTAIAMGMDIPENTTGQWAETMSRLSTADDLSEQVDIAQLNPAVLLEYLQLDINNDELLIAAAGLVRASQLARNAIDVKTHFSERGKEAQFSFGLLRHQLGSSSKAQSILWEQLETVSVAGIHLDSLIDARKDAVELPQFSSAQLAMGALTNFIRTARSIRPPTWVALAKASHEFGFDKYLAKKPLKLLFPSSTPQASEQPA